MTSNLNIIQPNLYWGSIENGTMPSAQVALAIGSNLNDPHRQIEAGLTALDRHDDITIQAISPFFWTEPVYMPGRPSAPVPAYLNGAAVVRTRLSPATLMETLLAIEASLGRVRRAQWDPRPLDIDMLLWDEHIFDTDTVTIPHPRMRQRAFVLVPLNGIASSWRYPMPDRPSDQWPTIADLTAAIGKEGVHGDRPIYINPRDRNSPLVHSKPEQRADLPKQVGQGNQPA